MKFQHKPRKRFGQHFLCDAEILRQIVNAINPAPEDIFVEIGPGRGALTRALLPHLNKLTVIELDRDLIPFLQALSTPEHRLEVISQDVLKTDFSQFTGQAFTLRIAGNLPYNISTPLIFHLLNYKPLIKDMVFMLQKEVVSRITSAPNQSNYGRLSIMVQYHCRAEFLFDVPPRAFNPPPQVDSAMIRLIPHADLLYKALDEKHFENIVRQAFSVRRKTLKNALKDWVTSEQFAHLELNSSLRPEELSVGDYVALANISRPIPK